MEQKREFFRIALDRRGEIRRGVEVARCEVLDLTEKGFQLRTDLPITAGDTLQLEFNLTETSPIHCAVQVTYVSHPHVGVRITEISPDDQQQLSQFIDQLNALNMTGF